MRLPFYNVQTAKSGKVVEIYIDISELNDNIIDHLKEVLKNKIKFMDNKCIIKTNLSLYELDQLNEEYYELVSNHVDKVFKYGKDKNKNKNEEINGE